MMWQSANSVGLVALTALIAGRISLGWEFATPEELEISVKEKHHTLVAYIDPSLDSSKELEAQWSVVTISEPSALAINCVKHRKICEQQDVASYPSIRLYHHDGFVERYRGARKANEILSFVPRCLRGSLSEVDSNESTGKFIVIDDVVFLGQFHEEDDIMFDHFEALAEKYHDRFTFGFTTVDPGMSIGVSCYNNKDQLQYSISQNLDVIGSLESFIKMCTKPLIPEITRRNELEYLQSGTSLVYYFLTTDKERDDYRTRIRPLAKKYREYLTFVLVDANEYSDMLPMLGIVNRQVPALAVQNPALGQVFPFQETDKVITEHVVEQFVLDIVRGKVRPWTAQSSSDTQAATAGHDEL